jgi:hypothetical protein
LVFSNTVGLERALAFRMDARAVLKTVPDQAFIFKDRPEKWAARAAGSIDAFVDIPAVSKQNIKNLG